MAQNPRVLSRMHTALSHSDERRQGFALVLALSFVAFVVLLLLSLTALVRVETTASSQALVQLQAEQNARLGLMMAIGDLQRHAGPDQRVTARADILDAGIANPFWTGIWDTTQPSAAAKWLVSGELPDPTQAATNTMQVVGPASAGVNPLDHVNVPTLSVDDANGRSSRIAWWVADEGVKASLGGLPLNQQNTRNYQSARSTESLEILLASSQGLEELFGSYDRFNTLNSENLDQIYSLQGLMGQAAFSDDSSYSLSGESLFHALSIASYGVLASVLPSTDGGLMRDLSLYPELISNGFADYLALAESNRDALDNSSTSLEQLRLQSELRGLEDLGALTNGQITTPITPVLSNFMMAFSIHSRNTSDPNLYLRMRFFCELWNPFTNSLQMRTSNGTPLNFELEVTGLPTVEITRKLTDSGSGLDVTSSTNIDIQSLLGDSSKSDQAMVIRLNYDHTRRWLPGQSMNWTGVDADEDAQHSPYDSIVTDSKLWNRNARTLGGSRGIDTNADLVGSGTLQTQSSGQSRLGLKLYLVDRLNASRTLLTHLENIIYEPVSTTERTHTNKGANFGYHIILRESIHSNNDPTHPRGVWLSNHDHRNPSPTFFDSWHLSYDRANQVGSPYLAIRDGFVALPFPAPEFISEASPISAINTVAFPRLIDRSSGNNALFNQLWQDTPLFELPRERPLTLASLQHLYFHNERPYQVGNSWGANGNTNTNEWFDRYYFSGFSRSDNPSEFEQGAPLPNPALINYSLTAGAKLSNWIGGAANSSTDATQPASSLMVKNRFNLNSTSIAAWKAVLGSLRINGWDYLNYPDDTSSLAELQVNQDSRTGMFSRYTHSLSETYDSIKSPAFEGAEPVAPSTFYRRGTRHLHTSEIESLATEIVRLLQDNAEPFLSMEAFLSAREGEDQSLLELAISNTLTTNGRQQWDHEWETNARWPKVSADQVDIDHFSPGFLTQADILSAIGPMLAPRSDTFKIRARSEVANLDDDRPYSATIEAVVQRTPTPTNSALSIDEPSQRRIQILSLRWLAEDEL